MDGEFDEIANETTSENGSDTDTTESLSSTEEDDDQNSPNAIINFIIPMKWLQPVEGLKEDQPLEDDVDEAVDAMDLTALNTPYEDNIMGGVRTSEDFDEQQMIHHIYDGDEEKIFDSDEEYYYSEEEDFDIDETSIDIIRFLTPHLNETETAVEERHCISDRKLTTPNRMQSTWSITDCDKMSYCLGVVEDKLGAYSDNLLDLKLLMKQVKILILIIY